MNNELFEQAKSAYAEKNFEAALSAYTQCLQVEPSQLAPGEPGLLFHQVGNCLLKMKSPAEATQAYAQALSDEAYDARGTVLYNLGMAYAALHDYENAISNFQQAVADAKYDSKYRAYTGLGNALMKIGKSAEAGVAFRSAALDEANPDPTKALLNLGICFMSLDRPQDAIASYESALQFAGDSPSANKLYSNLGQAYVACGQMEKAVTAFDQALADKTYFLSDSARLDYQRAAGAVSQGTSEITQVIAPVAADMSGLDVAADGSAIKPEEDSSAGVPSEALYADPYEQEGVFGTGSIAGAEDVFFNSTDEELERWSRGVVKEDRKRRGVGLKVFIVLLLLLFALIGGGVYAYTQGYGYPSQEAVVQEMFSNPSASASTVFAKGLDEKAIATMLKPVTEDGNVQINGVDKSMNESTVYATAKSEEGKEIQYKVSLVRDMLGWKISAIDLYFPSQN